MDFKSQDVFVWDNNGNINSPFAWHPDDNKHALILDTLKQLGCPDYVLTQISEIRDTNLKLPLPERYETMRRFHETYEINNALSLQYGTKYVHP